jgi:hypothetical protein
LVTTGVINKDYKENLKSHTVLINLNATKDSRQGVFLQLGVERKVKNPSPKKQHVKKRRAQVNISMNLLVPEKAESVLNS